MADFVNFWAFWVIYEIMVRPNAHFKIIFWKKLKFFNRICVFFNFCLFVVRYWVQYRLAWFSMNLITWHSWFPSRDDGGQIRISNMKTFFSRPIFLGFLLIGIRLIGSMTWAVNYLKDENHQKWEENLYACILPS